MDAAPALWWQHAVRAVLAEREALLNRRTLSQHPLAERGQLRRSYAVLYRAAHARGWWRGAGRASIAGAKSRAGSGFRMLPLTYDVCTTEQITLLLTQLA